MSVTMDKRLKGSSLKRFMQGAEPFCEQLLVAPAKLNLRLKVLGRRPDGYHLLSMLNVSASLGDELRISLVEKSGVEIKVQPPTAIPGPQADNLVVRAWDQFWSEFSTDGAPCGVAIAISKKIPVGGGLGGGSSDAAAILRFLVTRFGGLVSSLLDVSPSDFDARVLRVALRLGADVPYAYRGGVCWVTGIGDEVLSLSRVTPRPADVLIAMPPASVPTADFYRFLRERTPDIPPARDLLMERLASGEAAPPITQMIENDFERHVVAFRPLVGEALRLARRYYPETTGLTGSGAAIFSLVNFGDAALVEGYERAMEDAGMVVHRAQLIEAI